MTSRTQRLKQLLDLQERLKAVHETRRAGHLAAAAASAREIDEIMARRSDEGSLADLFPDVYSRFVDRAVDRKRNEEEAAAREAREVAIQTVRANATTREWRLAKSMDDRREEERDALEIVERKLRQP